MFRTVCLAVLMLFFLAVQVMAVDRFELIHSDVGVNVMLDGKLFTTYRIQSGNKPILWPVIGPTGTEMTRAYPMKEGIKGESSDHEHHRSFWFTHGDVNGISFWGEGEESGQIVHREFIQIAGGEKGKLVTRNDWISKDGAKQCEDERTHIFGATAKSRWIDFKVRISAGENPIRFGDTKEGCFGVRVAGPLKVEAKLGGKIVNSRGQTNKMAWGQPAEWVDYHGHLEGQPVGIAIMNHPSSFRHPTWWHVRTYGLFAANPFGLKAFVDSDRDGSHTVEAGESLTLRYRVVFHRGEVTAADVGATYEAYASEP